MAQYRCYLLGSNGQLVGAETIFREDDSEALEEARQILARRVYATGFELRLNNHLIASQEIKAS